MSDDYSGVGIVRASTSAGNKVIDLTSNWLELEFYTQSQKLKGQISCPAGMRILDLLNAPSSIAQNAKVEFIELKDYSRTDDISDEPKTVCIKKDDVLFVSAPDVNMGRGLGAKGEFQLYPFVPKTKMHVCVEVNDYSISGNLFRAKNQTMMDVLNNDMFFLPLVDVIISKDSRLSGDRPFVAVNKRQISECREESLSNVTL